MAPDGARFLLLLTGNFVRLVSVLLPVYNAEQYISSTLESLLSQTYRSLEVIVVNDGSTDETEKRVLEIARKDARVRYYSQEHRGLSFTPNRAFSLSQGVYIARMDGDDLWLPEKLAKQVRYLEEHPEVGMVGTWAEIWEKEKRTSRSHRHPTHDVMIKLEVLFNNPFVHSTVLMRREVFSAVGGYSENPEDYPEDYELLVRITEKFTVANIPEILAVYREVPSSVCRTDARGPRRIPRGLAHIAARNISRLVGPDIPLERICSFTHAVHRVRRDGEDPDSLRGYGAIAIAIYQKFLERYAVSPRYRLAVIRRIGYYLVKAYGNFYRSRI